MTNDEWRKTKQHHATRGGFRHLDLWFRFSYYSCLGSDSRSITKFADDPICWSSSEGGRMAAAGAFFLRMARHEPGEEQRHFHGLFIVEPRVQLGPVVAAEVGLGHA